MVPCETSCEQFNSSNDTKCRDFDYLYCWQFLNESKRSKILSLIENRLQFLNVNVTFSSNMSESDVQLHSWQLNTRREIFYLIYVWSIKKSRETSFYQIRFIFMDIRICQRMRDFPDRHQPEYIKSFIANSYRKQSYTRWILCFLLIWHNIILARMWLFVSCNCFLIPFEMFTTFRIIFVLHVLQKLETTTATEMFQKFADTLLLNIIHNIAASFMQRPQYPTSRRYIVHWTTSDKKYKACFCENFISNSIFI